LIILDTSILRSFSLESSSADLLRAIQAAGVETVGVPWMVREELVAQQAIKYQELHERAAQAVAALGQATPWGLKADVGRCDIERFRKHWRERLASFIDTVPTSDGAVRQALFREANCLPPCREAKNIKIGGRDAAIWLSAVEYAQDNPDETVYFVSANTKDFGDGNSLPFPMSEDVAYMADRFVMLTSMDEVASRFTEPTKADEALVTELLSSNGAQHEPLARFLEGPTLWSPTPFRCTIPLGGGESIADHVGWFLPRDVRLGSVEDIKAYRIGDREWCTASVVWHLAGGVNHEYLGKTTGVISWSTAVLLNLDPDNPHLTILRSADVLPASDDVLSEFDLSALDATATEQALIKLGMSIASERVRQGGLPRPYEGALMRQPRLRMGKTMGG
jgi:hypothetical protein